MSIRSCIYRSSHHTPIEIVVKQTVCDSTTAIRHSWTRPQPHSVSPLIRGRLFCLYSTPSKVVWPLEWTLGGRGWARRRSTYPRRSIQRLPRQLCCTIFRRHRQLHQLRVLLDPLRDLHHHETGVAGLGVQQHPRLGRPSATRARFMQAGTPQDHRHALQSIHLHLPDRCPPLGHSNLKCLPPIAALGLSRRHCHSQLKFTHRHNSLTGTFNKMLRQVIS
jgi:hypothetical protein